MEPGSVNFIPGHSRMWWIKQSQAWAGRKEGLVFSQGCAQGSCSKGPLERNQVCGLLLAGNFPLASIFAPLLVKLHTEQDRSRVVEF